MKKRIKDTVSHSPEVACAIAQVVSAQALRADGRRSDRPI